VVFSILQDKKLQTIVYIDGYNLYYGALKHSQYKWLDIYKLFAERICPSIYGKKSHVQIKFFTADILGSVSPSPDSTKDQRTYHNALLKLYPEQIHIIKGSYSKEVITAKLMQDIPHYTEDRVKVLKLEEKQTDVNIALEMYRDVAKGICNQVILCSNDTDLIPALSALSDDFPHINKGVVFPILEGSKRAFSKKFKEYCNWTWKHLSINDLKYSQLPHTIKTAKKPILKPDTW